MLAGLTEDLETVADAEGGPPGLRVLDHGAHDRAEPRDRARAQVVAVGESAGPDDQGDFTIYIEGMTNDGRIIRDQVNYSVE